MAQKKMLIRVEKLKKEYRIGKNAITALKGIDLEIPEGSYIILFGPSGSGKTTLLNLIGLIDYPTSGKVFVEDVDAAKLNRIKLSEFRLKHIGFIFQKYYLLEELTAMENVFLPAVAKDGFSRHVMKRAKHLLDLVGLKGRLNHKPRHLSEGEKQRIAIARSLVNEPRILLCDEPTASLDAENGRIVLELLKKINSKEGIAIFLVSHDERQLAYAEQVFYISDGYITKETNKGT